MEFYSVGKIDSDISVDSSQKLYATMLVKMDAREDTYQRTVFSVFDYTGLIGGVFELLQVFGTFFVGYFAKNWFLFCVLSNLYQIDNKGEDQTNSGNCTQRNESEDSKEHSGGESEDEEANIDQEAINTNSIQVKVENVQRAIIEQYSFQSDDEHETLNQKGQDEVKELRLKLESRRRYGFSW